MKSQSLVSLLTTAFLVLIGTTAHAMQIDVSQLDTLKVESTGLGDLHWTGVYLKSGVAYNQQATRVVEAGTDVRIDQQVEMFMNGPATAALTRIVTKDDGTRVLEHVQLAIDGDRPELHVVSRAHVRVDLVARIDSGLERAKSVPIYAYKKDSEHVVLIAESPGLVVSRVVGNTDCEGEVDAPKHVTRGCNFSGFTWNDVRVDITLGPEQRVGQLRGDITFSKPPKGETDDPHGFIVNASYAKFGRDAAPVLSLTTRVRETPMSANDEGEE